MKIRSVIEAAELTVRVLERAQAPDEAFKHSRAAWLDLNQLAHVWLRELAQVEQDECVEVKWRERAAMARGDLRAAAQQSCERFDASVKPMTYAQGREGLVAA